MNINPMQLIQAMKNPQAFMQQMMNNSQIMQNPMAKNIIDMAQKGDVEGRKQMGRNIPTEKGSNYDKAFYKFKKQFPIEK